MIQLTLDEALQTAGEAIGPDGRGRYIIACPLCGEKMTLDPRGNGKNPEVVPTCQRRCIQSRIAATLKERGSESSNGHREPRKPSRESTGRQLGNSTGSTEEVKDAKAGILWNPATQKPDYLKLQARCVKAFGPAGGILCRQFFYWTGKSELPAGWLYKSRSELREETGLGNRDLDKARAILRGEKPYAGRTMKVLEERHPNPTSPTQYRLDLEALAEALAAEILPGRTS